jgi:hypothetical protein
MPGAAASKDRLCRQAFPGEARPVLCASADTGSSPPPPTGLRPRWSAVLGERREHLLAALNGQVLDDAEILGLDTAIERELIGGECAYWACIPSKTLLRGPEARAAAGRVAGVATPALDWGGLRDYRDYMIRHLDDSAQVSGYEEAGATVVKGTARLTGPGHVDVDGRQLQAGHIMIATGSQPVRPDIDGLASVPVWTNREATNVRDIPRRVLLIGGSAVGVELAQFYTGMGAEVAIVQRASRLIDRSNLLRGLRERLRADIPGERPEDDIDLVVPGAVQVPVPRPAFFQRGAVVFGSRRLGSAP